MKYTGKGTGVNTSTIVYSERAKKRIKNAQKKFYKNYNEQCGKCIIKKVSQDEMEKFLKQCEKAIDK